MGALCCYDNQRMNKITIILAILNCPYLSNICTKLRVILLLVVLEALSFKKAFLSSFFSNLIFTGQPNHMVTGHKTRKLGRQSSNYHNYQIWFRSLHWL